MPKKDECETPNIHNLHMCQLLQKGLTEEIDRRSDRPKALCGRCGAKANDKRDLCQPRALSHSHRP